MIETRWGYQVNAETIPPLITVAQFNTLTGDRWAGNSQVEPVLSAVSQAIRNVCGWHVAPALSCVADVTPDGHYLALPALCVTAISSIKVGEREVTAYEWKRNGSVRTCECLPQTWQGVKVSYTSGIEDTLLGVIVAQIVGNYLAAPAGVREEHAGQVGISYNSYNGVSGGVTLLPRDLDMLTAYRLPAVM